MSGALLLGLMAACQTPHPRVSNVSALSPEGVWVSKDSKQLGVSRVKVSVTDGVLVAGVWAPCVPKDCYWGESRLAPVKNAVGTYAVTWEHRMFHRRQTIRIIDKDALELETESSVLNGSGASYTKRGVLLRLE